MPIIKTNKRCATTFRTYLCNIKIICATISSDETTPCCHLVTYPVGQFALIKNYASPKHRRLPYATINSQPVPTLHSRC